jgi:hypothetical protein
MRWYMKWPLVLVLLAATLFISVLLYQSYVSNPRVTDTLRSDPTGERAGIVMLLTFPDGRTIPVNYLREGDTVFAGADGPWWREFRDGGAPVTLLIRGETLAGHATVILDDPQYTSEVFRRLRPKAPSWLPAWLNGKLVVITLKSDV